MADLRTRKTFGSLKDAFLKLLEENRFEDITVSQLCSQAQIRRATFYSHFADKYEFLGFFIQEMRGEFVERICSMQETAESGQTREHGSYYDCLFEELINFFKERPQLVRNITNSQLLPVMRDIFAQEIQKSVYGYLKEQGDSDETTMQMKAHFYAGGLIELLFLWTKDPESFPVDQVNWFAMLVSEE